MAVPSGTTRRSRTKTLRSRATPHRRAPQPTRLNPPQEQARPSDRGLDCSRCRWLRLLCLHPTTESRFLLVHKHLRRLTRVWIEPPIYFITIGTRNRRNLLTRESAANVLIAEWQRARELVATSSCRTTFISFAGRNMKQKPCHCSSGLGKRGLAETCKKADRSQRQRLQLGKLFGNANSSIACCEPARATAKNGIMFVIIP
jgi:hypothetical protein